MAEKIRGLTVDITANAANFKKGMDACRKSAKETQSELNALQKSLELKFDSATFARAQKVAQEAIDKTAANVDTLRQRLAYLEKEGNVNTAEYERLSKELAQAELSAQQLQKQLEKINQINNTCIININNTYSGIPNLSISKRQLISTKIVRSKQKQFLL